MYNRREIAEDAFWGDNEELMHYILNKLSYPVHGFSLQEAIDAVNNMSDEDLQNYIK